MAPRIIYIDGDEKEVGLEHFLKNYSQLPVDISGLRSIIERMDYTGDSILTKAEYVSAMQMLDEKMQQVLNRYVIPKDEIVYLRGREYYLHTHIGNDKEKIRSTILSNVEILRNLEISTCENPSNMQIPTKELYACLLDHHKHYSMVMTFGLYNAMLSDETITKKDFEQMTGFCQQAIKNYYSFIVGNSKPELAKISEPSLELFKHIKLPEDRPGSLSQLGSSKLIHRDLDHPGQIILYAGNVLHHDRKNPSIDAVINPLFGSIEVGYGLKSIYEIFAIDKIKNIHFVRYSKYGEGHPRNIDNEDLEKFVPNCLREDFEKAIKDNNNRLVLMDDGIYKGRTLIALSNFIKHKYDRNIGITAVELNPSEKYIKQKDLCIPAIAVRLVWPINQIIKQKLGKL